MPVEVIDFVWLGIAILAAVVEAIVPSLVSVWFVPGSLAGLVVSLCPLAKKLLVHHKERTNADRVVGATGIVIQDIDNVVSTGRVTVMGNSWSARSTQKDGKIEAGSRVRIERIEGVKLLVTPVEPPQP